MGVIVLQDLDLWEELDDRKSELAVGGAVAQVGDNPFNGVPFTVLITPGQGTVFLPNENGHSKSEAANPNAFGAPIVFNAG